MTPQESARNAAKAREAMYYKSTTYEAGKVTDTSEWTSPPPRQLRNALLSLPSLPSSPLLHLPPPTPLAEIVDLTALAKGKK